MFLAYIDNYCENYFTVIYRKKVVKMNKNTKIGSIEFIRFLFSMIIVYFHILHSNIIPFVGNAESSYLDLKNKNAFGGFIVECFFIIGGYFLYKTYVTYPNLSVKKFIVNKIIRLWPVLFFSIVIALITSTLKIYPAIFNIFFLQCVGLSFAYKGVTWYISPFFWVSIFIFSLLKNFDNKKLNVILPIMIYFSYVININYCNGRYGRETIWNFLNLGVLRAIAGIGLGYMIGVTIEDIRKIQVGRGKNSRVNTAMRIICSLVELVVFIFLLIYFLDSDITKYNNQFIIVIAFTVLFVFLILGKGILSKFLDNNISIFLGRYAYSIYVMQQFSFWILSKTFWLRTDFLEKHMYYSIAISLAVSAVIGGITYHLIEKPSIKLFKTLIG